MLSRLRARLAVVVASLLVVIGALVAAPQPALAAAIHNEAGEWFYNNVLDEGQKLAYDQVLEQVQEDPNILMDGDDPSGVTIRIPVDKVGSGSSWLPAIMNAFTRDHPEYFWINAGQLAWTRTADGDANNPRTYELSTKVDGFIYTGINEAELPEMWKNFNAKVDEIVKGAPSDPLEAITYFDNWLSLHNVYNSAGLGALNISRCAYSGIVSDNSAEDGPVCYGYATALKVLLDRKGIKNAYIEGRAFNGTNGANGEQHAWNAVEYDGVWYAIDPTWNDPSYTTLGSNQIYFMVGTDTETTPQLKDRELFKQNHEPSAVEGLNYDNLNLSTERLAGTEPAAIQVLLPNGTSQAADSFAEAIEIAAANRGTTITLFKPVTLTGTVTVPNGTTINLNSQAGANSTTTSSAIAVYCEVGPAFEIEQGSTVTIVNHNASRVVKVQCGQGSAVKNDGTLKLGAFAQLTGGKGSGIQLNADAVSGQVPIAAEGAMLLATAGKTVSPALVVQPENQTMRYNGAAGSTVNQMEASILNSANVPLLQTISDPTGTSFEPPERANEWVLAAGPDGVRPNDADKLVNGDYTFILRPQSSDATDYYGYTVTLTVSVTVPKTVEELRAEQKQQLNDALAAYVEGNYLADNWAAIQSAYQTASEAMDAATDESAMQSIVDNFKTTADAVPTAAERLEAEQQKLKNELGTKFTTYKESDYTAENWAELKAAYEQGLSDIADATTIADAQTAQQNALDAMAAIEPKPVDPGTDPEPPVAQVTVTFQSRVPGEDPTTVTVDKGSTVARPTDPVLTGWRFTGWFSDTAYTKEWNFDDQVTSDLVLYAGWEEVVSEPDQEPDEPKKPQGDTSQNTQGDTLAKTSDSSIILVPMGLAAAGVAAITASRKR